MAKFLVLFALVLLPAIASAKFANDPFVIVGKTYCDTCRCGYETEATKYLPGCIVRVVCKDRNDDKKITYQKQGVSDSTGTYRIVVESDRGDDVCDMELVKSSDPECGSPNLGRDKARVVLTRNNGITTSLRHANNMGFLKNTPLASCPMILQKYQETDESD